jgi:hypothetical protein
MVRVGNLIEFNHGYNNDLRSQFNVIKIEGADIFVDWDCHWFPIQDTARRNIKIINQ